MKMKNSEKYLILPAVLFFASMSGFSMAGPAENKATAVAFQNLLFNEKKVAEAFEKYVGPTYTQHNPIVPDGKETAVKMLTFYVGKYPELNMDIKRAFAEDDYVVLHEHKTLNADDHGSAVVDIYRLEDGKIIEHWDVVQEVPETSANDNTMF